MSVFRRNDQKNVIFDIHSQVSTLKTAFTTVAIFITLIYWGILNAYVVEHNLIVGAWDGNL